MIWSFCYFEINLLLKICNKTQKFRFELNKYMTLLIDSILRSILLLLLFVQSILIFILKKTSRLAVTKIEKVDFH